MNPLRFESSALSIEFQPVAWDSYVIGSSVMQVKKIEVRNAVDSLNQLEQLINELSAQSVALISCRLPHDSIQESMVLEGVGFKFIEMVLHPFLNTLPVKEFYSDNRIVVKRAQNDELADLAKIAEFAFLNDRFNVDYRIPRKSSGIRYKNWVLSCADHPKQKAFKFSKDNNIIGFFIIEEDIDARKAYWHLTAISPKYQGKGLGRKCWEAMLSYCKSHNFNEVSTTISARNTPVLNLYSKLNFRFRNPEMTFHWVNNDFVGTP